MQKLSDGTMTGRASSQALLLACWRSFGPNRARLAVGMAIYGTALLQGAFAVYHVLV